FEKHDGTTYKLSVSTVYTDETEEKYIVVVITNLTELFKVNEAFKRYTSEEIAEFVLHTPEGEKQGGTSMDVSILMSDLRGFTAMSTKMSPDGLVTVLNHYFAQMSAIIKRYHGTVIEFLGDGIFVVFGAPKPHEAHPADAVRCAIEMQNAMEEVNAWNEENGYPPLSMGIAINSGEAVVGNIGSDARMKYGCMGETVNMAGRIESLSVGGQVLISESTKKRIAGELAIRDVLNFMAKGAKEEIPVYDIAGIGDSRLQSADKEILWQKTESSVPVTFRLLEGKAVVSEPLPGTITKMSEDHSHSILRTETQLKKLTNIVLDIGGDLYGKVTDETEAGYVICFTAKPDSFEAWCQTGGF
ncbi:MAG: adenylate/guanylate cyclase domain-containing protein, partial [Lachnospiraceae bacterium]|nr:adenylate/guanylate cyclase domain-containing protein [Lachnospiraceae bacterium]